LLAGAGEGDVAPFLQPDAVGAEDEGALDSDALAGVAGERVGMADATRFEVVAAQLNAVAAVSDDGEHAVLAVDVLDGGAGAVLDREGIVVGVGGGARPG